MSLEGRPEQFSASRFNITEAGGTELRPKLLFTKDGYTFTVTLNVPDGSFTIENEVADYDTEENDSAFLRKQLKEVVEAELAERFEKLSTDFAA